MITITCPSLQELTETLARQGKELPKEYDELLWDLMGEAKIVADSFYDGASAYMPSEDFVKPSVHPERIGECHDMLIAEGKDVCFLEFGAGVYADGNHPWAGEMPFAVRPGSWSETHARQFADRGFWFYNGTSYSYIPPTRAMFNASENLIRRLNDGDFEDVLK